MHNERRKVDGRGPRARLPQGTKQRIDEKQVKGRHPSTTRYASPPPMAVNRRQMGRKDESRVRLDDINDYGK